MFLFRCVSGLFLPGYSEKGNINPTNTLAVILTRLLTYSLANGIENKNKKDEITIFQFYATVIFSGQRAQKKTPFRDLCEKCEHGILNSSALD